MELLRKISPVELEYNLVTKDGTEYDVLIEIGYDRDTGKFWYGSMFFHPGSQELIKKSSLSTERLIELANITERIFERYIARYHDDVEFYLESRRGAC